METTANRDVVELTLDGTGLSGTCLQKRDSLSGSNDLLSAVLTCGCPNSELLRGTIGEGGELGQEDSYCRFYSPIQGLSIESLYQFSLSQESMSLHSIFEMALRSLDPTLCWAVRP